MEIHQYVQDWETYKRIIIVSDKGSVFIELSQNSLYDLCNHVKSEIWGLFVGEPFRKEGIAKQLMQYAENIIKQYGETCIAVVWNSSTPLWVLEWYKKSGYKFCQYLNDTDTLLVKKIKDEN